MTENELVTQLQKMRAVGASTQEKTAMGLLFGIIFDHEITACGSNAERIAKAAGDPSNSNISDGRKLAPYVVPRANVLRRWHPDASTSQPVLDDHIRTVESELKILAGEVRRNGAKIDGVKALLGELGVDIQGIRQATVQRLRTPANDDPARPVETAS